MFRNCFATTTSDKEQAVDHRITQEKTWTSNSIDTDNSNNIIDISNVNGIKCPVNVPVTQEASCEKQQEIINVDEAKENVSKLTVVPEDLQQVLPRANQVWNCDKIGVDPNGKWNKIVCTYKWYNVKKIWKTQEGEKAPFWVSFLFFS